MHLFSTILKTQAFAVSTGKCFAGMFQTLIGFIDAVRLEIRISQEDRRFQLPLSRMPNFSFFRILILVAVRVLPPFLLVLRSVFSSEHAGRPGFGEVYCGGLGPPRFCL